MSAIDLLKEIRVRRERLFKRSNPRVRPVDLAKDAWVLWAAYDLCSFPALKDDHEKPGMFKKPAEFFDYFKKFAAAKSSILLIEEDHKFFKDKRGPVAMVSIDNFGGWRIEPQFEFFHWATKRHRLAAAVSFLNMVSWDKKIGACVLRVADKDVEFCVHLEERYDLLRSVGKIHNGRRDGDEYLYRVWFKTPRGTDAKLKEAA